MAELARGAPIPLFDRLQSQDGSGAALMLSPEQLQISIGRELARLLNSRSRLTLDAFALSAGTTLDYGVPDFSALSAQSAPDMERLRAAVAHAIALFEPRLHEVTVRAATAPAGKAPQLVISGMVRIAMKLRRVNFELQLDTAQGGLVRAG